MGKKKRKRQRKVQTREKSLKSMIRQVLIDRAQKEHGLSLYRIRKWDNDNEESHHNIERSINDIINKVSDEVDYIADAIKRYENKEDLLDNTISVPYNEQDLGQEYYDIYGDYYGDGYGFIDVNDSVNPDVKIEENVIDCKSCKHKEIKLVINEEGIDYNEIDTYL